MATTNTLESPRKPVSSREWPTLAEFRAARGSDDLAELFSAVDREDKLRAVAARRLDLIHRAESANADVAQQRNAVLADAEAELRTFVSNLAATLDATAERSATFMTEMREAGLTAGESRQFVDVVALGDDCARALLARLAGSQS